MVWVKICDNMAFHTKSRAVGLMGTGLFVHVLQHCNRELSDGRYDEQDLDHTWPWELEEDVSLVLELLEDVMAAALKPFKGAWPALKRVLAETTIVPEALLSALLSRLSDVGFVDPLEDGGFQVHNYHRYQPTRKQVEHRREKAAKRQAAKRARDRQAHEQLSELAAALAKADGAELSANDHTSRRDARVTEGVTDGQNRRATSPQGARVADASLRSHRRTSGLPPAEEDVLMKNDPDPTPLVTEEGTELTLDRTTADAGSVVARAVRSYQELGRLDPYRTAAQGVRLMQRYGKPVGAIVQAIERLARDAGCAEMVGRPLSESQLGYWFGRYCDSAAPAEDGGARSEREHLERKSDESAFFRQNRGAPPLDLAQMAANAAAVAESAESRS